MSLGIQESDLLLREDYSALKLSVRDLHTCAHRFMRTDSVISDRWYIGAYTRCTLIPCKYRAAICSATVRVCVCVCVLNEIRLCPIHQGKSSFSASLLLHVGSWLSRPKPHVIYPATSPTNYSLHTAAENQRPHTFLTHTHTHTQVGWVNRREGQRRKKTHRMCRFQITPMNLTAYTCDTWYLIHPAPISYLFAWPVRKRRSCPQCCSSSAGVWTGTGTLWCLSWHLHRCTACGPGRAGTASSGPATGPPAGCTEAGHRWCRPRGSVKGSWPETWMRGTNNEVIFTHYAISGQVYASSRAKVTTDRRFLPISYADQRNKVVLFIKWSKNPADAAVCQGVMQPLDRQS